MRDSNLDADFPTDARYAEQIYKTEGGTENLQGVVAITPALIQNAMKITGPIKVPEYNETVTAQNVIDRIHYHQLEEEWNQGDSASADGHSSLRKRFTEILFEHFLDRLRQIAPSSMPQLSSLLVKSLSTKDIQLYLNASGAENVLQDYNNASTIRAPASDSLFIVDANISGGKQNNFVKDTVQDAITVDASGDVTHRATITYSWPVSDNQYQNGFGYQDVYTDYLRIYTPTSSVLVSQGSGWSAKSKGTAFNRNVWSGPLTLSYGKSVTFELSWRVPHAATQHANTWQYTDLIQKQAGTARHVHIDVSLPACASQATTEGKAYMKNAKTGSFIEDLNTDMQFAISYHCLAGLLSIV